MTTMDKFEQELKDLLLKYNLSINNINYNSLCSGAGDINTRIIIDTLYEVKKCLN